MEQSFYRRPLPTGLVEFSSADGRALFREALADGSMEGFFALSEQFHTQADPAFCGLGSLVVALNALGIDPGRLWKGPWRWFSESLLDCCVPLDVVQRRGVTLAELGCLAECNGARSTVVHASESDAAHFRAVLDASSRAARGAVLVVAYDRAALGQTGSGHFSPIGGYHAARDLALVLDVARFKYPPHWVPVDALYEAMRPLDPATGRSRGWLLLGRNARERPLFLSLAVPAGGWRAVIDLLALEVRARDEAERAETWAAVLGERMDVALALVSPIAAALGEGLAPEHRAQIEQLLVQVRATPTYERVVAARSERSPTADAPLAAEVASVLALVFAKERAGDRLGPDLAIEVDALRAQLAALASSARPTEPATD